jgi:hypothetical protein
VAPAVQLLLAGAAAWLSAVFLRNAFPGQNALRPNSPDAAISSPLKITAVCALAALAAAAVIWPGFGAGLGQPAVRQALLVSAVNAGLSAALFVLLAASVALSSPRFRTPVVLAVLICATALRENLGRVPVLQKSRFF